MCVYTRNKISKAIAINSGAAKGQNLLLNREERYLTVVKDIKQQSFTPKETRTTSGGYGQIWPAYNLAAINEKRHFLLLLHELCQGVEAPAQTVGRPRLPLGEMIFCAVYKVYSTFSSRRFMSDCGKLTSKN